MIEDTLFLFILISMQHVKRARPAAELSNGSSWRTCEMAPGWPCTRLPLEMTGLPCLLESCHSSGKTSVQTADLSLK
jgi:hypothetical protein